MRHRLAFSRLGRPSAHRRAMFRNLTTELLRYERIRTTLPKAKEMRRHAEKVSDPELDDFEDSANHLGQEGHGDLQGQGNLVALCLSLSQFHLDRLGQVSGAQAF